MNIISVKDRLFGKITSIEDEDFLNELEEIILNLRNESQEKFILSDDIKASIVKSELDIETGRLVPHKKAIQHFKTWLKSK